MNIAFRVDAATHIGTGHLSRCLTLAKKIKSLGHQCIFFSRNFDLNLNEKFDLSEFHLIYLGTHKTSTPYPIQSEKDWIGVSLQQDAQEFLEASRKFNIDICIIDHYSIDEYWESIVKSFIKKIVVIDDLANRFHDCDILIDQNYFPDYQNRYINLVSNHTQMLLGPKFTLLRDEFNELRKHNQIISKNNIKPKILINFGGIGHVQLLQKIIKVVGEIPKFQYTLITGIVSQDHTAKIAKMIQPDKINLITSTNEMAKLMSIADFAIGASGSTVWERFALGLNAALIEMADNQRPLLRFLDEQNLIDNLGNVKDFDENKFHNYLNQLDLNNEIYLRRRLKIMDLVDGLGATRISQYILGS